MEKNDNNKGTIELWGQDFNRAESGLDEEQVVSFVNELTSERDELLQRQEYLSSLSVLAERTIVEAHNLAKQVKEEAIDQAKTEANVTVAEAEEQAQQMIEEKRAEAIALANKEAEAIRANAQQQAEVLREEKTGRVQSELRDMAQRLYGELLSQLESLRQQVAALAVDFERTLSQPAQTNPITMDEENNVTPGTDLGVSLEVTHSIPTEALEQIQTVEQSDTSELEEKTLVSTETQETTDYGREVELEIMPPVDMRKIMGIIGYLESLPEVDTTELITVNDNHLIEVFLREPIHLIEMLIALPEVSQVKEVTEDKRRKIQIVLSGGSVIDETKRRLNDAVSHLLGEGT